MTGVTDTNLMSVRKRSFDVQDLLCEAGKTNFQGRKNISNALINGVSQ